MYDGEPDQKENAMKPRQALKVIRNLSEPSKIPCYSWSISATKCITGSKLAKHPGSVCHDCYALKGNYIKYPCVAESHERHLIAFDDPDWIPAMVIAIGHYSKDYFRWFDSGDLQSVKMLSKIVHIAESLPGTRFWLPTKETAILRRFGEDKTPDNLVVRVSGFMKDQYPTMLPGSMVYTDIARVPRKVFVCPAPTQNNKCLDCRACWDDSIEVVAYKDH